MEWLIILGCVVALIVAFSSQSALRSELHELQKQISKLGQDILAPTAKPAEPPPAEVEMPTAEPAAAATAAPELKTPEPSAAKPAPLAEDSDSQHNFERQFGGRAFVWIGGVALALAGFFLVKYSIEMGLVTETVRIILGLSFGAALILASLAVYALKNLADGTRIAQALAGAGVADLYGSLFAATTLYHLVPPWIGFAAMAGVTVLALVLSLRIGSPIAVLGLIGGYATPALIHGEPNTPLLFGYLYIVCAGLTAVARGRQWWWLPAPTLLVAYGWVLAWLLLGYGPVDAFWLALFLTAVGVTAAAADRITADDETEWPRLAVRNLAPAGALLLMGTLTYSTRFGPFEWAMFAVLSLWAMLLARFDGRTYRLVPWLAMAANIVMLAMWNDPDPWRVAAIISGFALLFAAGAQLMIWRSGRAVTWALFSAVASLAYFLLAYAQLSSRLSTIFGKQHADYLWSGIALTAALVFAIAIALIYIFSKDKRTRQLLQATYTAAATALVSIALTILLDQQYLPFAFAVEVLALSWLARGLDIPALRPVAMVLTGLFVALSLQPLSLVLLGDYHGPLQQAVLDGLFRFLLPAAALAASARNWRKADDGDFVRMLEFLATLLSAAFLQKTLGETLAGHATPLNLMVASAQTGALLLWAVIVAWIGRASGRNGPAAAAALLAVLTGLHLTFWNFLTANPLFSHQWVGALPIANGILAAYGAPALLCGLLARAMPWRLAAITANIAAYVLAVVTAGLLVRQLFHGAYLDGGVAGNAELYAYSVAGLVAGILLLLVGVARSDPPTRVASLVVMMLTVGKVFLFDASALTGLWRVVSFLGLGFSLLALSWFYSRFVFRDRKS